MYKYCGYRVTQWAFPLPGSSRVFLTQYCAVYFASRCLHALSCIASASEYDFMFHLIGPIIQPIQDSSEPLPRDCVFRE